MKVVYFLILLGLALAACAPVGVQPTLTSSTPTIAAPAPASSPAAPTSSACLPSGIEPSSIVSAERQAGNKVIKVTVQQKLDKLSARCQNGTLVDSTGKEIRFYELAGCWGNPPDNYQDILQRQQQELATLKAQYTVIEMTCNPSGLPIQ